MNETTEPVDNLGGVLSIVLVGALILGINFAPVPNETTLTLVLFVGRRRSRWSPFFIRQRRAANPLYDLHAAARPTFWVAACAGLIVFGSLMGAMFIGQQFLQNVLDYSTVEAGAAILPAAAFMVVVAPRSAKLVEARGARFTLLFGYVFVLLGFLTMLLLWKEDISYWKVALGYSFVGIGVGLAGHAGLALADRLGAGQAGRDGLGHRRPAARPRRGDHAVDLRRAADRRLRGRRGRDDLLLRQGRHEQHAGRADEVVLQRGRHRRRATRRTIQDNIIAGAKTAFLQGDQWAYLAGIIAVLLGAALVYFMFPKRDDEKRLLASYALEDAPAESVGATP